MPAEAYHPHLVFGSSDHERWLVLVQPQSDLFPVVGIPGNHSFVTGLVSRVGSRLRAEGTWSVDGLRRASMSVEFPEIQITSDTSDPLLDAHVQLTYHLLGNLMVDFDIKPIYVYLGRDVEP